MKTIWTDIVTVFDKLKALAMAVVDWTKKEVVKLEAAAKNFIKNIVPAIQALEKEIMALLATIAADAPAIYAEGKAILAELFAFEQALATLGI